MEGRGSMRGIAIISWKGFKFKYQLFSLVFKEAVINVDGYFPLSTLEAST